MLVPDAQSGLEGGGPGNRSVPPSARAGRGILCPGARLGHRKSPKRAEMKATPAPGGCSAGTELVGGGGGGVSQEATSLALEGLG